MQFKVCNSFSQAAYSAGHGKMQHPGAFHPWRGGSSGAHGAHRAQFPGLQGRKKAYHRPRCRARNKLSGGYGAVSA